MSTPHHSLSAAESQRWASFATVLHGLPDASQATAIALNDKLERLINSIDAWRTSFQQGLPAFNENLQQVQTTLTALDEKVRYLQGHPLSNHGPRPMTGPGEFARPTPIPSPFAPGQNFLSPGSTVTPSASVPRPSRPTTPLPTPPVQVPAVTPTPTRIPTASPASAARLIPTAPPVFDLTQPSQAWFAQLPWATVPTATHSVPAPTHAMTPPASALVRPPGAPQKEKAAAPPVPIVTSPKPHLETPAPAVAAALLHRPIDFTMEAKSWWSQLPWQTSIPPAPSVTVIRSTEWPHAEPVAATSRSTGTAIPVTPSLSASHRPTEATTPPPLPLPVPPLASWSESAHRPTGSFFANLPWKIA